MSHRRGIVLAAVLVVAAASLWTTVALLARAGVEISGVDGGSESIQAESAMRSAVLVYASELFEQRDELRVGVAAQLDEQIVLWESGTRSMVARLMHLEGDQHMVAEASRLDINHATADQLDHVLGFSESILSTRGRHRFDDAREVLPLLDQSASEATGDGGLCDRLTVHAHEPNVQQNGNLRINLAIPWSEELGERIATRFDKRVSDGLQAVLIDNPVKSDADLIRLLLAFDMRPSDWPDALDAFSMEPVQYRLGRIDINSASAEVLASVPGVTSAQASAMVERRSSLDSEMLATPAWPFIEGLLPVELAVDFLDRTTTGSWTWRVRIACGELPSDELDAAFTSVHVAEVVLDVAGEQPRIAMMRDVTMRLQTVAWPERLDESEEEVVSETVEVLGVDVPVDDVASDPSLPAEPDTPTAIDEDGRLGRWRP